MGNAMTLPAQTTPPAGADAPAVRARPLAWLMHRRLWVSLRSFGVFFLLWWLLCLWNDNPLQLPSPLKVLEALWDLLREGEIAQHASVSTLRMLLALTLSMAVAVPLGFVMGLSRRAEELIDPLVEILRPISGIAWLPLALFIFGVGDTLPVFIMFYVGFFPILLNTVAGVRQTDARLLAAARTMGVGRLALLVHVLVPSALPTIMVGIRLAFAASWAAIVAAELIGSPSGLGFAIEWYRQLLMTPKVFAFILAIGVVGYVCDLGLRALQRRLTPWAESMGASS
jgi:ABC-type nitrate/sulfonate/bicarbonate transport system permease component